MLLGCMRYVSFIYTSVVVGCVSFKVIVLCTSVPCKLGDVVCGIGERVRQKVGD